MVGIPLGGECSAVQLRAQPQPPGTEFLDAETGCQKSPLKYVSARRDENPRSEWPEIPAETPYLASYRKRAVCEDWMVEVLWLELMTHHPVLSNRVSATPLRPLKRPALSGTKRKIIGANRKRLL